MAKSLEFFVGCAIKPEIIILFHAVLVSITYGLCVSMTCYYSPKYNYDS